MKPRRKRAVLSVPFHPYRSIRAVLSMPFHLSRETCYCRSPLKFEPSHGTSPRTLQELNQDTFLKLHANINQGFE